MRTHPLRTNLALILACALAVACFLLDFAGFGGQFGARYLLPIVVAYLWGRRRDIYIVTTLASVLVVAAYWFGPPASLDHFALNHIFILALLWAAAWLLAQRRALQEQLARRDEELTAAVAARTAELAASEQRYRLLAESTTDIVWTVDLQGRLTYASPALAQLLGYTGEDLAPHIAAGAMPPLLAEPVQEALAAAQAAQAAGRPFGGLRFVIPQLHKDGIHRLWTELFFDLLRDDAGTFIGLRATTRDITQRYLAEEALAASEAQLAAAYQEVRLAANAAHLGIWTWTFAGDTLYWDDRMCELYATPHAQSRAGITYAFWRDRVHPDDLAAVESALAAARRDLAEWISTFRIVLPGGEVRYIYAASMVEQDAAGVPFRMVGVNRDVTDQVRYEQLLQQTNAELEQRVAARTVDLQAALVDLQAAGRLKDEFMAMISHELRTPLSGVLTLSEMLEDQLGGPLTQRQATYVQGIRRSGDHLLEVINGILGYVQLIGGRVQLHPSPCHLAPLLAACADPLRARAAARSQLLEISVVPPDLALYADTDALAEVIKRLLDNAIRFTPDGGRIGLAANLNLPAGIDIVVWDTGIGIASNQIDRILKPFTQGDGRLSRSHEGIGMGLAYVDQMVRLLGGTLQVASTLGQGSRFTVTLPAHAQPLAVLADAQL